MLNGMGYVVLSTVVAPMVGVIAYKLKSRQDMANQQEIADIKAKETPVDVLKGELAKREAELVLCQAHTNRMTEQYMAISSKEHETASKERIDMSIIMTKTVAALDNINASITAHRDEENDRAAKLFTKVEDMHRDVIRKIQ